MTESMLTDYVHIGFTGTCYHPLYLHNPGAWVLANADDPTISLPGFYTTDQIARVCKIDEEELVFIKLKYNC